MNACMSEFRIVNPTLRTFSAAEARIAHSSIRFNNLSAAELGYPEHIRLLISSDGCTLAIQACDPKDKCAVPFMAGRTADDLKGQKKWTTVSNRMLTHIIRSKLGWETAKTPRRFYGVPWPALWDRNQDSITRSDYNYVYSKQSKVFHTRNCSHVLLSFDIQGTVSYETCLKSGRRPCKHCKPVPIERKRISLPIKQNKPQKAENRNLNGEERKALGRFKRAKEERETAFKRGDLTEAERNTVMALSQPGLAFWASKGYSTFHTRNCSKITGLNQLRGFARYQDAVRAGYSPCRHCRPSPKLDVKFSIPITNKERHGETTDTLIQLCTQHCLPFEYDMRYFTLQTIAGKWRIDMSLRPVRLEHINLVTERGSTKKFHTQPRLFLSLKDTFDYIMRHDSKLIEEIVAKDNQSQELAMG